MFRYAWLIAFLLLLSCGSSEQKHVSLNFYHWKSGFEIDSLESNFLNQVKSQKIYLRAFDVDWNATTQKAVPLAEMHVKRTSLLSIELVPVIFITNRTMIHISYDKIAGLGDRIIKKIRAIWKQANWASPQKVQLDCDWSSKSRRNYFHLLDYLKKKYKLKISTTIRLHQYKYPTQTGVPPVDQGVLMIYNMGDVRDASETNSILNLKAASAYLNHGAAYPLSLQVALPLFSWGVLQRQGKVIRLLPEIDPNALKKIFQISLFCQNTISKLRKIIISMVYMCIKEIKFALSKPSKVI